MEEGLPSGFFGHNLPPRRSKPFACLLENVLVVLLEELPLLRKAVLVLEEPPVTLLGEEVRCMLDAAKQKSIKSPCCSGLTKAPKAPK